MRYGFFENLRSAKSQKNADLIYSAEEAGNHELKVVLVSDKGVSVCATESVPY